MKSDISGQKQKKKAKKTVNVKWIVTIFFATVLISGVFSTISNMLLGQDALKLLKNAEKVSSFCNDVVGDICGVISGTASASIVLLILSGKGSLTTGDRLLEIGMAALVSGLTVGGKAIGKTFAMTKSTTIVHWASLVIYYIKSAPGKLKKLLSKRKN